MKVIFVAALITLLVGCSNPMSEQQDKPSQPNPDAPITLDITEIENQVAELYQDIDAAFDESFVAGIDFVIANNYPGAFDPAALQECAFAKEPFLGDNVTGGLPRTETLKLIPDWVGRDSGAADWLLAGKTISGDVYEFDLEVDLEIITGQIVVEDGQVFLLYGWCDDQRN